VLVLWEENNLDANLINPFVDAVTQVLPQVGVQTIGRGKISAKEQFVESRGVTILVGMTKQVRGNIAYNMTEQAACSIASTMMMGMPVASFDEMAQSALSELANMVTANAAILFSQQGLEVDISTPSMIIGHDFKAKLCNTKYIALELQVDSEILEVNIGVEKG